MPPLFSPRLATPGDIPALEALIAKSARTLQASYYTLRQIEGALGTVFGVDRLLIEDGTYFVVEAGTEIVACGGWSRRRTLFGSDLAPGKNDAWLDPAVDAARVRAFFVHPKWARRGLGSRLLRECEAAASTMGFTRLELVATLTGEPLYQAHGYAAGERFEVPLSNDASLPVVRMAKAIAAARGKSLGRH